MTPFELREFNDGALVGADEEVYSDFSLDSTDERDRYEATIIDGTDGHNPNVTVEVSGIPAGHDYALVTEFNCSGENQDTSVDCKQGEPADGQPTACTSDLDGNETEIVELNIGCSDTTTDNGIAEIRVTSNTWDGACSTYEMRVRAE